MRRSMIFLAVVCLVVAVGEHVARRPPDWLDDDPLLQPFGIGPVPDETSAAAENDAEEEPVWPLDLATADAAALTSLPGVGPVLARRILAQRDSLGGIDDWAQLDAVKGIGPATLARIQPLLRLSSVPTDSQSLSDAAAMPDR
jgi:hypothetical protein